MLDSLGLLFTPLNVLLFLIVPLAIIALVLLISRQLLIHTLKKNYFRSTADSNSDGPGEPFINRSQELSDISPVTFPQYPKNSAMDVKGTIIYFSPNNTGMLDPYFKGLVRQDDCSPDWHYELLIFHPSDVHEQPSSVAMLQRIRSNFKVWLQQKTLGERPLIFWGSQFTAWIALMLAPQYEQVKAVVAHQVSLHPMRWVGWHRLSRIVPRSLLPYGIQSMMGQVPRIAFLSGPETPADYEPLEQWCEQHAVESSYFIGRCANKTQGELMGKEVVSWLDDTDEQDRVKVKDHVYQGFRSDKL